MSCSMYVSGKTKRLAQVAEALYLPSHSREWRALVSPIILLTTVHIGSLHPEQTQDVRCRSAKCNIADKSRLDDW